jgi:hypothetical protein
LRRVDSVVSGALQFPSDTMSLLLDVVSGGAEPSRLGTRTTFDELQSTGSFRLIESASLRSAILGYYGNKDLAERRAAARVSGYNEIVDSYIPSPPVGGLVGQPTATARQEMLRTQGSSRAARIVTAPDFEGAITRQRNYVALVLAMLETLLVENLELMTAVETELRGLR